MTITIGFKNPDNPSGHGLFGVWMTPDEPGYYSDDEHYYTAGMFTPNYPVPTIPVEVQWFKECLIMWDVSREQGTSAADKINSYPA